MKIILTGATGFLGKELLNNLIACQYKIVLVKRKTTDIKDIFECNVQIDSYDFDSLEDLFDDHTDVDAVVHAATDYGLDDFNLTRVFWANEALPIKLIELAIKNKVKLFINIDTFFSKYRKNEYNYLQSYTLSKRQFLEWGKYLANSQKISFSNIRLFHLYGPGDRGHKFIPTIVKRCLQGGEIDLTEGDQKRDFIYISDAVSAVGVIIKNNICKKLKFRHYDIGTGESISIKEIVLIIKALTKSNIILNFGALPYRKGEFNDIYANTLAIRKIDWAPKIDIKTGLLKVINESNKVSN